MAILKITQSQSRVRERQVAPTSALVLPLSLAAQRGQGVSAIGKVVDDIHKEQVAIEDNNKLLKIIKTAAVDIEKTSSEVSKNTDLNFAINTFENETKPERFENLLTDVSPNVKKQFNQWLNKTKISEYSSITKKVTQEHINSTKQTHNDYLDDLTLKMASSNLTTASNARTDFESFFRSGIGSGVYSTKEYAKLEDDKRLQSEKNIVLFGAKNHPNYTIQNFEEIKKNIDPKLANKALEVAKQKIVSDQDFNIKQEEFIDKANTKEKVATFTEILLRIRNDDDPEYLGKIPTLDLLNDLRDANKINSAQYEALLRFYKDPKAANDDDILDLITAQIFIAETVEDLDRIQNNLNFSPEYLASIGIKDAVTMTSLIDKFKNDREVFQDYKDYEKTINNLLGKVESGLIREFGPKEKSEQGMRVKALRLYNEYIDEGLSPENAFLKVSQGYLANNDKVPTIYDAATITSIKIPKASKIQKDADPDETFNGWRNKVMEEYKKGNISMNELKRDLGSLDIMQDIFDIRSEIEDATGNIGFAWGISNKTTGGAKR